MNEKKVKLENKNRWEYAKEPFKHDFSIRIGFEIGFYFPNEIKWK
jgi:hypothetical protein